MQSSSGALVDHLSSLLGAGVEAPLAGGQLTTSFVVYQTFTNSSGNFCFFLSEQAPVILFP